MVLAVIACILIFVVAVLQISLAAGAPLGQFAWGGQHRVLPQNLRRGSAASVLFLALAAWIALARADMVAPGHDALFASIGIWVLAAFFALNTLGNLVSKSKPERYTMSPITIVLCGCFVGLALT